MRRFVESNVSLTELNPQKILKYFLHSRQQTQHVPRLIRMIKDAIVSLQTTQTHSSHSARPPLISNQIRWNRTAKQKNNNSNDSVKNDAPQLLSSFCYLISLVNVKSCVNTFGVRRGTRSDTGASAKVI